MKKILLLLLLYLGAETVTAQDKYHNPVLPGFHPDPSVCRVGEDYYMINSSFEWFPGIPVYHSRDMINWTQIGNVLTRPEQLNIQPDTGHNKGIWAPTIRYHDGLFYVITTAMQCGGNFLVTAKDPRGPWSDPIWIREAMGIDPSLFWDEDGTCWYIGAGRAKPTLWDAHNDVYMAKLDPKTGRFLSEKIRLTSGHAVNAKSAEGPHLYKIGSKYVLLVAEGGTGPGHAVTVFTSSKVTGPYEAERNNPVLTHRHLGQGYKINSVGHADLVEGKDGQWWAVMLGRRRLSGHFLARETFLCPVSIEKGVPVFNPGKGIVEEEGTLKGLPVYTTSWDFQDDFESATLSPRYCCLRTPQETWWRLENGKLRMRLNEPSFSDLGNPSFWGIRVQSCNFDVQTHVTFPKLRKNEQVGLLLYRTRESHISFAVKGAELQLVKASKRGGVELMDAVHFEAREATLCIEVRNGMLRAGYKTHDGEMHWLSGKIDVAILGDDMNGGFNGPFIGMATSSNGENSSKDVEFDYFKYKNL